MFIHWKVPKDDGNSEIRHYIVEKQNQKDMRRAPCGESRQLNMKEEGLIEDHEYLFRIRAVNDQDEGEPYTGPKEPVMAKWTHSSCLEDPESHWQMTGMWTELT